jgi:hypothetical protein
MLSKEEIIEFKNNVKGNSHEIYVIALEELDKIAKAWHVGPYAAAKEIWGGVVQTPTGYTASWYGTAKDSATTFRLLKDLGFSDIKKNATIRYYGGKPHVIFKGNPHARKILTAAKYGLNHPKIVSLGITNRNIIKGAKSGAILTIVLVAGFRVIDFFLNDETTLSRLVGTLATDIVKVSLASAAGVGAAAIIGGIASLAMGTTTVLIAGPIIAAIFVGAAFSWGLDELDKAYGITDSLVKAIDTAVKNSADTAIEKEKNKQWIPQIQRINW